MSTPMRWRVRELIGAHVLPGLSSFLTPPRESVAASRAEPRTGRRRSESSGRRHACSRNAPGAVRLMPPRRDFTSSIGHRRSRRRAGRTGEHARRRFGRAQPSAVQASRKRSAKRARSSAVPTVTRMQRSSGATPGIPDEDPALLEQLEAGDAHALRPRPRRWRRSWWRTRARAAPCRSRASCTPRAPLRPAPPPSARSPDPAETRARPPGRPGSPRSDS